MLLLQHIVPKVTNHNLHIHIWKLKETKRKLRSQKFDNMSFLGYDAEYLSVLVGEHKWRSNTTVNVAIKEDHPNYIPQGSYR